MMVVRKKKVVETPGDHDSIDLSANLQRVREAIINLPTDEEIMEQAATEEKAKKLKPGAVAKPAKKSADPKPKKIASAKPESDTVALADLCKELKVEPRVARRKLRTAGVEVEGQRWAWKKGSADLKKVADLLKAAD